MLTFKMTRLKQQSLLAASFSLIAAIYTTPSYALDDVVFSFATVGDSRQDPVNIDPSVLKPGMVGNGNCQTPSGTGLTPNPGLSGQDCKWLQNTTAWSRIMRTIQSQKAKLLFFNGDMIMGYGKAGAPVTRNKTGVDEGVINSPSVIDIVNSDIMQFYKQYAFWRGMVANLMESGTYVVPVPGNHEVQCKRCGKAAQVENENAWRDNMGDLILDPARFSNLLGSEPQNFDPTNAPGGLDGLATDQKQLSFSFDVGTSHFVVINTDPVGADGHAPTKWLEADLVAAEAHGAKHSFVFGHKPAYFYLYSTDPSQAPSSTSSLWNKDAAAGDAFWAVINNHKATYFAGHEHIYNVKKPFGPTSNSYQVIVGAAGSPFDSAIPTLLPSDRMYSWATVKIFRSGKVVMETWGFDDTMVKPIVKLATILLAAH
jgi:Calcineurin-like phosphoesterase